MRQIFNYNNNYACGCAAPHSPAASTSGAVSTPTGNVTASAVPAVCPGQCSIIVLPKNKVILWLTLAYLSNYNVIFMCLQVHMFLEIFMALFAPVHLPLFLPQLYIVLPVVEVKEEAVVVVILLVLIQILVMYHTRLIVIQM